MNIVDYEVSWNNDTKSIYIGSQPAAAVSYNRTNPAPLNTAQTVNYKDYFDSYNATVSVTEVLRGSGAWTKIKAANMFNDEPKPDHEYILAKIKVTVNSVKDDAAFNISSVNFDAFDANNAEYNNMTFVVTPDPALNGQMYSGSTKEGYVAFEVRTDDAAPKMVFGADYNGSGGAWFKLY